MVSTVPVAMPAEPTQRLSPAEIQVMRSAAAYQARRIARSMRLPPHAIEDAEQEILLAVVMRRRYFDASRGPWLPFVQRVAAVR